MPTLINRYHDEDACRADLEALRWPNGVACPKCGTSGDGIARVSTRNLWRCNGCTYQFSVLVGTVLQDTKLPLWKWFLAVYMMGESKKSVSANQLKRMLGVSYKTAWYLCHRIRAAMKDEGSELLSGIVEERSDADAELVAAAVAIELPALGNPADLVGVTTGATDAIRPAQFLEIGVAAILGAEPLDQLSEVELLSAFGLLGAGTTSTHGGLLDG